MSFLAGITATVAETWLKTQAFAIVHQVALTLIVEAVVAIGLLIGVAYCPRTCIVVVCLAYAMSRYWPAGVDR